MSNFMLMEPANQAFGELLGNGVKYSVPRFQRDYAWDQEQWEDLHRSHAPAWECSGRRSSVPQR